MAAVLMAIVANTDGRISCAAIAINTGEAFNRAAIVA